MDNQPQNQPSKPEQDPVDQPNEAQQPDYPKEQVQPTPPVAQPTSVETEPQTVSSPTEPSSTEMSPPPKKSKKGLIAIIVAAVLVVLAASAVLAYNFWYQSPDKVVGDSLMNAIKAKTMTFKATLSEEDETSGEITLEGAYKDGTGTVDATLTFTSTSDDKQYTVKGNGIFDDKGDLYVKITNLGEFIDKAAESQNPDATILGFYDEFVTKVNDKWVKVSSNELREFSEESAKIQQCLQDTLKKIQEDDSLRSEIVAIYEKHRFVTVKEELGSKDGSLGYLLESDDVAATEFAKEFKNTQVYKSLHDCDDSFTIEDEDLTGESDGSTERAVRTELWVSRWGHEITELNVVSEDTETSEKTTMVFEPEFNKSVEVTAPEESMTADDVMKAFEELQVQIFQYSFQQAASDPNLFSSSSAL